MIPPPTATLCRILAEGELATRVDPAALDELWHHATWTSVDELLAAILCRPDAPVDAPARARAVTRLREATARELARLGELSRILDAVATAGVRVLLMKGAGLAYTVYDDPRLRPGDDIDLLIARSDLDAMEAALTHAGYRRCLEPDAELASMQRHYQRITDGGVEHCVDLHWKVANRQLFADVLDFEESWERSIETNLGSRSPGLFGPGLTAPRTLGVPDALMLACVHRVAHHPNHSGLLWLFDIHLLAARLTPPEWRDLVERAAQHQMRAVVASGVEFARELFGTPIETAIVEQLRGAAGDEASARFLDANPRQVDLVRSDLRAARAFGDRLRLLREHLLPAPRYMRARYPRWPAVLLPLAYLHRAARGAPRWLRRPASGRPR